MNQTTILLVIFILAFFLRIAGPFAKEALYDHKPFILFGDEFLKSSKADTIVYNLTAKSLIEGHGHAGNIKEMHELLKGDNSDYDFEKESRFMNDNSGYLIHKLIPPGYPIFLAICYVIFGINTLSFYMPQILLSAFSCILIYFIAKKIFNARVAIISSLLFALYPDLIFWTYMVRTETLFIFLLALIFWLLLKDNKDYPFAFIMGALLGITCLTKLTLLFFAPIIIVWEFLFFKTSNQRKLIYLFILCFSFILTLSPWIIRNYAVFGSFSILTDEVWTIFTTNPPSPGDDKIGSYILILFKVILNDPYNFVAACVSRLIKYLSPFTDLMRDSAKSYKCITWLVIFPMSFVGMLIAIKKYWSTSGLIILFILYYILLHSITYVDVGLIYRYPIQPFLCIFAAYGYWLFYKKYHYCPNVVTRRRQKWLIATEKQKIYGVSRFEAG